MGLSLGLAWFKLTCSRSGSAKAIISPTKNQKTISAATAA